MVSVPVTTRRSVETQPLGNDRLRYSAPRNLVGPAIEQFGQAMGKAAQDWDAIEATYDEADTLNIVNQQREYRRQRLRTGENAYLNTQGFDAGKGMEAAVADLRTSAENLMSGARSERARNMARRALDVEMGVAEEAIASHATQQMTVARNEQSQARIGGAVTDAIDARGTEQFDVNLGVARMELSQMAGRLGWSPEQLAEEEGKLVSNAYSRTVLAIDAEDGEPTRALEFLKANKDAIHPDEQARLETSLNPRVDAAWAREQVGGIVTNYVATQPAPKAADPGQSPAIVASGAPATVGEELARAGYSSAVVAGFLGNFEVEGGYGGARGDGGSASGIAQWRNERRTNFRRRFGKEPHEATAAEQARFVVWEMENPAAAGMTVEQRDAILSAATPQEAAALIDRHYERSSGAHRSKRQEAAQRYAGAPGAPGVPADPRLSSANVQEAIERYVAANPDISERRAAALRAAGDQFVSNARAERAQAEQDADRRVMDWLTQNKPGANDLTDLGQIPAAVLAGASPSALASLQDRVQVTQNRIQAADDAAAKRRADEMESAAIFELYTLSDQQLATVDLRRYAGRVGLDKLGPWIDRQQRAASTTTANPVSSDRIAAKIDSVGKSYGASRAPDASEDEKRAWTALRGFVEIRTAGKANKEVTDEDLRGLIVAGMQEVEIPDSGWFSNDRKPRAQIESGSYVHPAIPAATLNAIKQNLRVRVGREPTGDEIWIAYQAGKARGIFQ